MAVLIDTNNRPIGTQKNDPPPPNSSEREFLRVLRIVEAALRQGTAETCATLESCIKSGYGITHNPELDDMQAEVVSIMRLRRDVNNKLQYFPERWIALGEGYLAALEVMKANQK